MKEQSNKPPVYTLRVKQTQMTRLHFSNREATLGVDEIFHPALYSSFYRKPVEEETLHCSVLGCNRSCGQMWLSFQPREALERL